VEGILFKRLASGLLDVVNRSSFFLAAGWVFCETTASTGAEIQAMEGFRFG
jgi:hypothetical protein